MSTAKISISVDEAALTEARNLVGHRGLSSYINRALQRQLQRDRLTVLLAELKDKAGPIEPSIMEEIRSLWPSPAEPLRRSA